uniref:protein-tyrosine-phosphatase n=1 Tax=Latimeria chalumnae TaxID=7897 RepID=H3B354_LATCH
RDEKKTVNTENITLVDLEPGTTYNVSVLAVNGDNSSTPSSKTGTTCPSEIPEVIAHRTMHSLNFTWHVLPNTNESPFSYNITFKDGSNNRTITSATNTVEIPNLQPGLNYNFTIYTITKNGVSSAGYHFSEVTQPSPVFNISLENRTTEWIKITWDVPEDQRVSQYWYWVNVTNEAGKTQLVSGNSSDTSGLSAGVNYTLSVESVTPENVTSDPKSLSAYTRPNDPVNLKENSTTNAIHVSWEAPPKDVNKAFYRYKVLWKNMDHPDPGNMVLSDTTEKVFHDLSPGNIYKFSVFSVIEGVDSPNSDMKYMLTVNQTNSLQDENVTQETVTLSWQQNKETQSRLTGYNVSYSQESQSQRNILSTTTNQYKFSSLTPGQYYKFDINSYIETAHPTVAKLKGLTYPSIVQSVSCCEVAGGHSLDVTWGCASGRVSSYNISVSNGQMLKANNCTTYRVTGLSPASWYQIIVYTVSGEKSSRAHPIWCYTDNAGVIAGAVIGVLLFLALLGILGFFILQKKRKKKKKTRLSPLTVYSTKGDRLIPVSVFADYFNQNQADSNLGFTEEYQKLNSVGTQQSSTAARLPENRPKNRFTNVIPYDSSRVLLRPVQADPTSDYINASYMPGYYNNKEFIATQGPLPDTVKDFWRMVWDHNIKTVVMLTSCTESGRIKCAQYWPLDYTPCTYEDIIVSITSEDKLPDWTLRDFTLKHAKFSGTREVRHFHFAAWRDHAVPDTTDVLIQFRHLVRNYMDKHQDAPTIVHCSAGVGRTGTFIALDYLLYQMKDKSAVSVYGIVHKMRQNRPLMVQTEAQYVFLNQCMLDVIHPPHPQENLYENMSDVIYENTDVIRKYERSS